MSPARELLLRGAARVAPWGWSHPALGGHDRAPRVAGRPAEPQNAGPDHRRSRRGRHGHRACAPPPGPGRPDAPNSDPGSAGGPDGSDLIPGGTSGRLPGTGEFPARSVKPHTQSAHRSSACASTVFTASSCKSGEPKEQGD